MTTIIEGRLDDAWQAYPALAGADAQSPAEALHDAFSILSAYGHRPAAVAVGRLRLAQNPDDAAQRYLLDALEGRALMRAPVDYSKAISTASPAPLTRSSSRFCNTTLPSRWRCCSPNAAGASAIRWISAAEPGLRPAILRRCPIA